MQQTTLEIQKSKKIRQPGAGLIRLKGAYRLSATGPRQIPAGVITIFNAFHLPLNLNEPGLSDLASDFVLE
jgi:hypothetical protein